MFKTIQRFYSTSKLWSLETLKEANILGIKNNHDGKKLRFPFVWLRDNCQCPQCYNQTSKSRIMDLKTNLKLKPIEIQMETTSDEFSKDKDNDPIRDNYKVHIKWKDGHLSGYTLDWLRTRSFSEDNRSKLDEIYKIKQIPWTSNQFEQICSRFDYNSIVADDRILLKWLENLSIFGVAIIERAGVNIGTLKELASRIGFLKKTQYGETFTVEAKSGTSNVAYLSSKLQLHTDLPYYEYKPGLNLLHCIVQSQPGQQGMNQLTDCLAVCRHLATNRRETFHILSHTIVDWSDYGEDNQYKFANIHRAPVICLDARGEITRINFSQPQRDSVFNVPLVEVEPWYEAMSEFIELLHDSKYLVELKLRPGEILTFDNVRLVHGRLGYSGERLLEGGYLDWDLVRSRVRVLRHELGNKVEEDS